jgi:hypothetical protein
MESPEGQDLGKLEGLLISNLRNLLEARNRCAHGIIDTPPDLSTLFDHLDAVEAIGEGILGALEDELVGIQSIVTCSSSASDQSRSESP